MIQTVNLENELLEQNSEVVAQEEKIIEAVKDILDNATEEDVKVLEDAGLSDNVVKYKEIMSSRNHSFDTKRVFKIDQIRSLCIKYGLRFLSTDLYKGDVPYETVQKLKEFRSRYGIKNSHSSDLDSQRYFIAAPKGSFRLKERPKDPLLFYKIDEMTYYLIHKWGDDMSLMRKVINFPMRSEVHLILSILSCYLLIIITICLAVGNFFPLLGLLFGIVVFPATIEIKTNNWVWNSDFND